MVRTAVGDKYVMEEMVKRGFALGGEQSGHVIFSDHLFTGDGLATALNVLRIMADTGKELAELARRAGDVSAGARQRAREAAAPISRRCRRLPSTMREVEEQLAGNGRLLVRYSGTEPLLRIMLEGKDDARDPAWADEIAGVVREHLAVRVEVESIGSDQALRQRQQGRDRAQLARRARCRR